MQLLHIEVEKQGNSRFNDKYGDVNDVGDLI